MHVNRTHPATVDLVRQWLLAHGADRDRLGQQLDRLHLDGDRLQALVDHLVEREGLVPHE